MNGLLLLMGSIAAAMLRLPYFRLFIFNLSLLFLTSPIFWVILLFYIKFLIKGKI